MAGCALRNRIKQVAGALQNLEEVVETLVAGDVIPTVFEVTQGFDVSQFERRPFQSTFGRRANLTGTVLSNVGFQLELKGSGTAGSRPDYAKYLLGCGFAEVQLHAFTISAAAGGPLAKGDVITGGLSGATGRVFVVSRTPATQVIIVPITGTFAALEALTGPNGWSAQLDVVDTSYGWGFEPYSKSTKEIRLGSVPAYQPGEHVLGSITGALGRVLWMGSDRLWYEPLNAIDFNDTDNVVGQVTSATGGVVASAVSECALPTPPMTLQVVQDGVRKLTKGARGRVNFNFPAVGEPIRMEFEFQGVKAQDPDDFVAFPEVDDQLIPPKFQGATVEIDGPTTPFNPVLSQMNIQVDNTLAPRLDATDAAGLRTVLIVDRDFNGGFDPEMVAVSDYGFHANWFADELEDFYVRVQGQTPAGNTAEIYASRLQYTGIDFGNRDDILLAESNFRLAQIKGDDAMCIVIR